MSLLRFPALLGGLSLWAAAAGSAFAQAAPAGGAADGGPGGIFGGPFGTLIMFLPIVVLFYFLIMRPQSQRQKQHQAMVTGVKRGDTVVLSSGMVGKVTRVEDTEAMVEIAAGVNVRVVKSMLSDVRTRGEPAKGASQPAKALPRGKDKSKPVAQPVEPESDDTDEAEAS
jgi:preprotein translocase subunit YajC